jgi:phosphoglycerate kinase
MEKLNVSNLEVAGKKVLVRVDFNVPMHADGTISDDTRIRESLPTIQHILNAGGSVILMSHLGRPKGKKDPQFSLAPCAKALSHLLNKPVIMAPDCVGKEVEALARELQPGQVLLLENLRFYPEEEKPEINPAFAEQLAHLGDLYVNDAFGTAHRAHSSTAAIARYFPQRAAAGMLMQKEIAFLGKLASHPKRPFYALIGGSKISTKIGVLHALLDKVDVLFIGGAMAYTFFKAQGIEIGSSLCEPDQIETAKSLLELALKKNITVYLPTDHLIASSFSQDSPTKILSINEGVPTGWQGVDIGPKTLSTWENSLKNAATIFWNGPVGVFEIPAFAKGTEGIAQTLAHLSAITIVGGGDSVAAVNQLGLASQFSHISTGGGASLEYLEQGHLPGIDVLSNSAS